jgi:hypothetical protein
MNDARTTNLPSFQQRRIHERELDHLRARQRQAGEAVSTGATSIGRLLAGIRARVTVTASTSRSTALR